MTLGRAIKIIEEHNKWRRGDENATMQNPTEIGEAIDMLLNVAKDKIAKGE